MRSWLYAVGFGLLLTSPMSAQVLPGGHHNNTSDVTGYVAQVGSWLFQPLRAGSVSHL